MEVPERARSTSFLLQGEPVNFRDEYCYLGVTFTRTLSFDRELERRITATRKALFAKERVLRCSTIPASLRVRVLNACVVPVALWGSPLWFASPFTSRNGEQGAERLRGLIATGLRWILGANSKVAKSAIEWELGVIPLPILAMRDRVRLYTKMITRGIKGEGTKDFSAMWSRHLICFPGPTLGSGHVSWRERSFRLAKKIEVPEPLLSILNPFRNGPKKNGRVQRIRKQLLPLADEDAEALVAGVKSLSNVASTFCLKAQLMDLTKKKTFLPQLREAETVYGPAKYLSGPTTQGIRMLFRVRTNSLMLNDRLAHFATESTPQLKECTSCSLGAVEDINHFIVECPAYASVREEWFTRALAGSPEGGGCAGLERTEVLLALLGEQPAKKKDCEGESLKIREHTLAEMFRVRASLVRGNVNSLAVRSGHGGGVGPSPSVHAVSISTTQNNALQQPRPPD